MDHHNSQLRRHAIELLGGYGLQFVAGMLLNLFVTIPHTHPGSSGSEYFARSLRSVWWALSGRGGWVLVVHVILGLGLVAGSISLLALALARHNRRWRIPGGIAALLTAGAFFNGMSFVDYNYNASSMIMAICWLGAVFALGYGLIRK